MASFEEILELVKWPEEEKGSGCKIVIVDTGVNPRLPVKDAVNLTEERLADREGHGLYIHAIIHSLLPEAEIYYVKIPGECDDALFLTAIQKALEWRPHAINISYGSDLPSDGRDPVALFVDRAATVASICVAAGNSGPRFVTIGSPAAAHESIAVGGVTPRGRVWRKSSRGPTLDWRWKPNLVAPQGFELEGETLQGTSFSTPFVTAAAAVLMREVGNSYIVRRVLELTAFNYFVINFRESGQRIKGFGRVVDAAHVIADYRNIVGAGLLDAEKALEYVKILKNIIAHPGENTE